MFLPRPSSQGLALLMGNDSTRIGPLVPERSHEAAITHRNFNPCPHCQLQGRQALLRRPCEGLPMISRSNGESFRLSLADRPVPYPNDQIWPDHQGLSMFKIESPAQIRPTANPGPVSGLRESPCIRVLRIRFRVRNSRRRWSQGRLFEALLQKATSPGSLAFPGSANGWSRRHPQRPCRPAPSSLRQPRSPPKHR